MKTALRFPLCLLAAALISGTGCEDDDNDGIGTSVNSSRELDDLSADERSQLCEDTLSAVDDIAGRNVQCLTEALLASLFGNSDCTEEYDGCLERTEGALENQCRVDEGSPSDYQGCDATVGELMACLNDSAADTEEAFNELEVTLSCEMTTADYNRLLAFRPPTSRPESCQAVNRKCPGLV